jgi:hypothetical protein
MSKRHAVQTGRPKTNSNNNSYFELLKVRMKEKAKIVRENRIEKSANKIDKSSSIERI